jgi:hypothetical protein
MAGPTIPRTADRSSNRNIETARLGLCGAAIGFVRALDGHADPAELGHRLERLRSRATDYLMAVRPGEDGQS